MNNRRVNRLVALAFIGLLLLSLVGLLVGAAVTKRPADTVVLAEPVREIQVSRAERFSQEDIELLARLVSAEARDEPFDGQVAVANVVLNRVASNEFPDTIRKVIYQPGQFESVSNDSINAEAAGEAVAATKEAIEGLAMVGPETTFFYNPKFVRSNAWIRSLPIVKVIGNHAFCSGK